MLKKCMLLFISISMLTCRTSKQVNVTVTPVLKPGWQGFVFTPDANKKNLALLIASTSNPAEPEWQNFCREIAVSGYTVFAFAPSVNDSASSNLEFYQRMIHDAIIQSTAFQDIRTLVLLGENQLGIAAVMTAMDDARISGAITLGTFFDGFETELLQSLKKSIKEPILIISSMKDSLVPQTSIQNFYEKITNPKKLVWLAESEHGAAVLKTDMEAIVARVTVMFLEKQSK
jgi:pimeloyl-ACP methyl ester carboxylesterase